MKSNVTGAQMLFTLKQKLIPALYTNTQQKNNPAAVINAEIIHKIITHKLHGQVVKDVLMVQRMRLGFDARVTFFFFNNKWRRKVRVTLLWTENVIVPYISVIVNSYSHITTYTQDRTGTTCRKTEGQQRRFRTLLENFNANATEIRASEPFITSKYFVNAMLIISITVSITIPDAQSFVL